ncbi:type I polyketide synthase [Nodularia spumigena CS-584]|jgi:acyl transferase domain-containing protein|uniref:type I polyketide synthase n=1 Tax=Nodularia spumigena TaxID=70799 RepID=UPI0000EA919E|nr:type I polyketide synthase [Nodularia spumigena]AHJ27705.1 heterocyst glycolipid synthase [Nodularia spumigena CCY9414]EAW46444.1 Beta-ketoacyl synthase [Nodularia spumigena CCY9414]MDB9383836.1 type I polyketide synthase [Nodularia spumigena CS-584]
MAASKIEAELEQLQDEISNCENSLLKLIQGKKIMVRNVPLKTSEINTQLQKTNIAIVGMASIFPQAKNLQEYWENIIHKVDCITDVPPSRWSIDDYYDANPRTPDKTYCKRGGFIPDVDFNPMEFGLPPNTLEVTDISQLLGLLVAKSAIEDAGYGESRQFNRERTGVVLGVAVGRQLALPLSSRMQYPVWEKVLKSSGLSDEDTQIIIEKIKSAYVQWNENAFPGMLANVITGRIANRLDLGGMNCVVDAACASSLGALKIAISELVEHRSDMMLTGGVDTDNTIMAYMCFSKTPAVSPSENVKPFDADSDGMMLGEGVGILVLKRLEDADRDNDRIYAVIKGIGSSSDGRYKSIYAPRSEGQIKALNRAYEDAECSPASVGLIEAHGTGTLAGDPTEFSSIKAVFGENNPKQQHIALGSVKSQIGHTKAAAGAASLIKTALALHHKVLPPTINITQPHPKLNIESSPFYLNTQTRPWIATDDEPRRAGVSAFGFGGTNYHVVLEEYKHEHNQPYRIHNSFQSILISAKTPAELLSRCEEIQQQLQSDARERHYAELIAASNALEIPITDARVGFVANSLTQAGELWQKTIDLLKNKLEAESWEHPQGIYYRKTGISTEQKVVALFSGQGSQYLEMGRELVINFPCLRQTYAEMDRLLCQDGLQPVSEVVFPKPVFNEEQKAAQMSALQLTEYAQPAIGAFSVGLYKILQQAGFKADMVAGHSFGELTALWAAGVLSEEDYCFLVKARGQAMATPQDSQVDNGTMLAVKGDVSLVKKLIEDFPLVNIANLNSPQQMVLAGTKAEIAKVEKLLTAKGFHTVLLKVSAAFHTSLVAYALKPFANAIERVSLEQPQIPVYTNFTGTPYPNQARVIQNILKEHLGSQVLFQEEIENIYAEGGYCFVEFGPRNTLTNLVKEILGDASGGRSHRSHIAVALNTNPQKDSDRTLREAVVQLRVAGLPLFNLDPYQQSRPIPADPQTKVLNVRLNSTNYVSDKTKQLFENALQNGHQAKLPVSNPKKSATPDVFTSETLGGEAIPTEKVAVNGGTKLPTEKVAVNGGAKSMKNRQLDERYTKSTPSNPEASVNYQTAIDNLEYTLIEFNRHQRQILQVHEQSLKHQTEYTKTFFGLMQQQHILWGNGKFIKQQPQSQQLAISSSERSIMRFHEHQADSLRIHEQYLNYQQEYTNNFFQLVQQNQLPTSDDTTQNSLIPSFKYEDSSTIPVYPEYQPVAVATADAVATESEPVSTNGNGNGNGAHHQPIPILDITAPQENQTATPTIVAAPPVEPVEIDAATLSQTLLTIVSDKTGYPSEMLEMSMDIEADLGIDSIKRVEILGALLEIYPDLPQPNPEELAQLRTLAEIAEYIKTLAPENSGAPATIKEVLEAEHPEEETAISPSASPTVLPSAIPDNLSEILLTIVSDKTGYPSEMLEMSMDIEADLGIDSIKRVEILGALLELYPDLPQPNPEEVAPLRTLQEIVDYIEQTVKKAGEQGEEAGEQGAGSRGERVGNSSSSQSHSLIRRSPAKLKFLPEPDVLDFTLPAQHIALLTDDGSVTTTKLAEALSQRGWKTVVLSFPESLIGKQSPLPDSINRVVLTDLSEEHLQQQLNAIASEYGKIAAFIHLNPSSLQNTSNHVCYLETEKSLLRHVFLTAKYLKESLNQAAESGRSCFFTVARLDGEFGLGQKTNFGAISSGLFGLTKTVNQEWEPVFCRALDISPDLDAQTAVEHILAELHDYNRLVVEVGYSSQGRTTLICEPESNDIFDSPIPNPQSQVFLVSGGAKGITAKCVIELAQRYQCKFILLGRSAAEPEPVWAEGYVGEAELKKRIMEDFVAKGDKPTPAMVQKKFKTIASRREIAATLEAIEKAGGQAEYLSVDVTDAIALSLEVANAVERLGAVTGIIHAAGNLADKRIEKKTLQDFETVYSAKVKGLENLLRCIPASQLQYLVLFSSVVGFYGNVGQSDYAIANEILNKSAHLFKRNHPNCHVVAINWGPWDSGMVSPELKKAFAERNIEVIPLKTGAQILVSELEQKNHPTTQVVIGSPLVYTPGALNPELKSFRIQRQLTLAANPFLHDHVIAGKPVLPATCAFSWIANTCEQLYPGYKFFSCQNFKVLKGIIFDGQQANEYTLDLVETSKSDDNEIAFQAKVWSNHSGKIRYNFSANIKLRRQIPVAPTYELFNQERTNPDISTSFYQNGASSLFHGSAFQGVESVLNISPETITIDCLVPKVEETKQGQFLVQTFNPYIVDVQIHALWIWSQYYHQVGCLPSEIHNFEQFAELPFGEKLYISCEVQSKTNSAIVTNVITHDAQGKIYTRMMDARGIVLPQ